MVQSTTAQFVAPVAIGPVVVRSPNFSSTTQERACRCRQPNSPAGNRTTVSYVTSRGIRVAAALGATRIGTRAESRLPCSTPDAEVDFVRMVRTGCHPSCRARSSRYHRCDVLVDAPGVGLVTVRRPQAARPRTSPVRQLTSPALVTTTIDGRPQLGAMRD